MYEGRIMSSKLAKVVADVASDLGSPDIVADIDRVLVHLWDLRKIAVSLHGESAPSPLAPVESAVKSTAIELRFDGTVSGLISRYTSDPDSPYQKLSFRSRVNYGELLKRIERDHGSERIFDLKARDMLRWHETWTESGVAMAHALIRMFRALLSFGTTILEDAECGRLSNVLSNLRFKMSDVRHERLTPEQVKLIRAEAHKRDLHSIALAQALQFECGLRQLDVIGEWVPETEPGPGFAEGRGQKWRRGILCSEIDGNWVLRRTVGKRNRTVEIDLKLKPMVREELERIGTLPKFGPLIKFEVTGRPYSANHFRDLWREIAKSVGVSDKVRNADSRMSTSRAVAEDNGDDEDADDDAVVLDLETEQGAKALPH